MTAFNLDTPLGEARGELRELLISLAETHIDSPERPCCDAETTLRDWIESGLFDPALAQH